MRVCRKSALSRHSAAYSLNSAARTRNVGGRLRASTSAVVKLTTRSNLVGCLTGPRAISDPKLQEPRQETQSHRNRCPLRQETNLASVLYNMLFDSELDDRARR